MSKNKKTRIAKGLGASALAIATLASGLSFGAASATASEGQDRAEASATYAKFFAKMQPSGLGGADNGALSWYYALPRLDSSSKPNWWERNQTMLKAETESEARQKATALSALSTSEWRLWKNERSQQCYYVGQAAANGAFLRAEASLDRCDGANKAQWFKLSESGDVIAKNLPAGMKLNSVYDYYGYSNGFSTYRTHMNFTNRDWDAPTYGDGWSPSIEVGLSGSVMFDAPVNERAVVSGATAANGTVEIRRGSTVIGTGTADKDGNYKIAIAAPNKAGDDKLTVALVENGADKKTIEVVAAYGEGVEIKDPVNNADVSGRYEIRGKAQVGSTVTVKVGNGAAQAVTVSENGQWSQSVMLPKGESSIVATQKSKGANTTTSTVVVNPGQDGNELPAPTAQVVFPENVEQRAVANGTGAAGASIEIFDGEKKVGSATVGTSGTWTSQLVAVSNGVHTLTIKQTLGDKTNEASVQADYGTELGVNTPAAVKDTSEVTLTGAGTPGAKIEFRDATGTVRMVRVADNGTWSLAGNFRPGITTVTVSSVSKGAVVVRKDTTVDVSITTRALTVTSPTQDDANNDRITDGTVSFTGTATPFATVQFATWPDGLGREVFTTYADANGNWKATGWLAKSYYKLSGVQYAVGGDITRYNMFPFSTVGFQALNVEGPSQGDVVIGGINTFTGTATPGATVEVKRKDTGQVIARGTAEGEQGIFNAKTDLRVGVSYQLEAVQTTLTGKTDTVDLGTITPVASQPITDLAFTHDGTGNGNNITFTFTAQPGAEVSVWTGPKEREGIDPWIRPMATGTADKYGHVKISGYAAVNNPYNLKVYAGTQVVDYNITTTPTK